MNDIMEPLIKQNGDVNGTVQYLGKAGDKWLGVPSCIGSQIKGPCSRIDLMKKYAGIDVQEMYPAGSPPKADNWTTDTFLKAAEACHKGGFPFGIGLGETTDNVDTAGAILPGVRCPACRRQGQPHGQDRRGAAGSRILQEADAVPAAGRRVMGRRLQQQVAGLRQGRNDHESAERLGGRQARRAAGRGAVLDAWLPGGTEGPVSRRSPPSSGAVWNFSKNKEAAKSLIVHLSQPSSIEKLVAASGGYDLPAFEKLTTLKTWAEEGPPKGTLYHYPNPYKHQILSIAASPAPPKIAQQIYTQAVPDQDVPAILPGRSDGKDAGLGGRRVRRLHAKLTTRFAAAARTLAAARCGKHPSSRCVQTSGAKPAV